MAHSRFLIPLSVCALALGLMAPVSGQTKICLVDMAKVFKSHSQFNQRMQTLKAEADAFQVKLQGAQQMLMKMNEELRMMDANDPQYRTKESEIAQTSANLEVERRNQVRDLMMREAQIHFETYASITQIIGQYCAQNSVPLVLRFVSAPMDLNDPTTVEQAFNNSVVYYHPTRDITDAIIQQVAQTTGSTTQR